MQKIKGLLFKIQHNSQFQQATIKFNGWVKVIRNSKLVFYMNVAFMAIFLYCQIAINLQKANGVFPAESSSWLQAFSWSTIGCVSVLFYLDLRHEFAFDKNHHYTNKYTILESILASILIVGIVSIAVISIGKITWLLSGGIQMSNDLAAIRSFCLSPTSTESINYCKGNCAKSIIIYNAKDNNLYTNNPDFDIKVVTRPNKAEYVACVNKTISIHKTCKYEKGREYTLKYEEVSISVFSLFDGKQKGTRERLIGNPPNCPLVVITTDGVSDFPYLTEVNRYLIYQSIKSNLNQ